VVFCSFLNLRDLHFTHSTFDLISGICAIVLLALCFIGMAVILFYLCGLRKIPLYKMRERTCFKMIYDDFKQEDKFSLLFFTFFFMKRMAYGAILAFLSDNILIPLNLFLFAVCIIPMLYFSYALPFKYVGLNAMLCLNEFSETLVAIVLLHYKDAWISDNEFFGYAEFLVKYITIWILINLLAFLLHLLYAIVTTCCKMFTFRESGFREK
jgi:hypothetical protein